MTSASNTLHCLIPLGYLGAIYLSFKYLFLEKKNILLCPCKKAVTWSCKKNRISGDRKIPSPVAHGYSGKRGLPSLPLNGGPEGWDFSGTTEHQ